uniref:Golgin subfamily A member 7/ERF4 domain-containing protein n=1 Tax=Ditylenchus dipsaci TaxID=166011 RepID=A0A915D8V4_9BILA
MSDEIDVLESDDDLDNLPRYTRIHHAAKPIVIKGIGQLTVFGLSSRFDSEFPAALTGKLAPEELQETMERINFVLQRSVHTHIRWLLCGLLFCCCTIGCSLWPVVCLSKRTIAALEKTLDHENQQLYNKLGLHWRLAKLPVDSNSNRLTEYVLLLETLPKVPLLVPD